MSDDATLRTVLLRPHASIRQMMAEAVAVQPMFGDPRRVFALTDTFLATLSRHLGAAEDVIYPAVRKHIDGGRELAAEQIRAARQMERTMRMIEGSLNGDIFERDIPRAQLWADMSAELDAHEAEERDVVSRLEKALTAEQGTALARSFQGAVKHAPTRPHPYSPHSPLLGRMAHRWWSLADRAMDEMDTRIIPHEPAKPHRQRSAALSQYLTGTPMFAMDPPDDESGSSRVAAHTRAAEERPASRRVRGSAMKLAVIGSGNVGKALAAASVSRGHEVVLAAGQQEHAAAAAGETGAASAASNVEAVTGADLVVLAVPHAAVAGIAGEIAPHVSGVPVVDATNVLTPDYSGMATGERSGAEELAALMPGVPVVKAFNTIFASRLGNPVEDGIPLDGFAAGDDADAKGRVLDLLESLGFRPIDAGPLTRARALEHMGFLNISLNAANGWSWQTGWKLLGPTG